MGRPYSEKFLLDLHKDNSDRIGVKLARICVKAGLPTSYVARVFGVSRMSIHSWFRGQYVRGKNFEKIQKFISIIERALEQQQLPMLNNKLTKNFLDSEVIDKI